MWCPTIGAQILGMPKIEMSHRSVNDAEIKSRRQHG
jgi:hypothetical protein